VIYIDRSSDTARIVKSRRIRLGWEGGRGLDEHTAFWLESLLVNSRLEDRNYPRMIRRLS
jgi:hypothetical protein